MVFLDHERVIVAFWDRTEWHRARRHRLGRPPRIALLAIAQELVVRLVGWRCFVSTLAAPSGPGLATLPRGAGRTHLASTSAVVFRWDPQYPTVTSLHLSCANPILALHLRSAIRVHIASTTPN